MAAEGPGPGAGTEPAAGGGPCTGGLPIGICVGAPICPACPDGPAKDGLGGRGIGDGDDEPKAVAVGKAGTYGRTYGFIGGPFVGTPLIIGTGTGAGVGVVVGIDAPVICEAAGFVLGVV